MPYSLQGIIMSDPTMLDERQEHVSACLEERNARLAGVYRSAIRLLLSKPEVGCEVARVSMICHCVRELMNNLPGLLSDGMEVRPIPSSGSLVSRLPELLASHPDLDLTADQDIIPVPRKVAACFSHLVAAATKENGRNARNIAALLTGEVNAQVPAIKQWRETSRYFVGWAHLDRNFESHRDLPSDEELLAKIRVVEDIVEVRAGIFFENVAAVQRLLENINAISKEDA